MSLRLFESVKQMKAYTDPGKNTYDALIDDFEEGMTQNVIDEVFADIKRELIPLVKEIVAKSATNVPQFYEYADVNKQKEWSRILLEYIGFDFNRGTIAESEHPFTLNLSTKDVRITNHYYPNNLMSAFYTIIHEGGHGIFEQNVNEEFDDTSLTSCQFMGIHESQSRFFENILGRNINFWKPIMNKLQEDFPQFKDVTLDEFNREINHIENSLIRVDADELTYCFHIILRYELERDLLNGKLAVKDLPKAWNEKMQKYLSITPTTDSEGVLQDSHWSGAAFGYFPAYLLGSIYDGMFLDVVQDKFGKVDEILAKGEIQTITKWLNEKIHQYGSSRLPMEVIEEVCHKPLTAEPFIRYAKEKYTKIYGLD
ncbi:MAG: carboxypeptidase M32 [Clostridiales bacterium]|nr:carboxypeptidase M32 [Clostridiales bacterium]